MLSYGMSKAALDSFTKTMASDLMSEGVRVNSINPATVRTDIRYQIGELFLKIMTLTHRLSGWTRESNRL